MEDLIRREDAIAALYKYTFVDKKTIEKNIRRIPAAEPPRGEWHESWGFTHCSVCGRGFSTTIGTKTNYKYCPFCGAYCGDAERRGDE